MDSSILLVVGLAIAATLVVITVATMGSGRTERARQNEVFDSAAELMGLARDHHAPGVIARFVDGGEEATPSISGDYGGVHVRARIEREYDGHYVNFYSVAEAKLSDQAPGRLNLFHEGLWEKLGKVVGARDIQVDDPELDDAFIIKGAEPDIVRAVLASASVKEALLAANRLKPSLMIQDGIVCSRLDGRHMSLEEIESRIRTVADIARAINDVCGAEALLQPNEE